MVLGSTGEFLFFSPGERKRVLEKVCSLAAPLPVIANVSELRPSVALDLARSAEQLGVAAVAVLPPYYYESRQDDILAFFLHIGRQIQTPLLLYNFPERVGNRITVQTFAAAAAQLQLAGVKLSGSDFELHAPLVELARKHDFSVFTGADARLDAALSLGAHGCISGLANAVPDLLTSIYDVHRNSRPQNPPPCFEQLRTLGKQSDRLPTPLNIAAFMEARGRPVGTLKPLLSSTTQAIYRDLVRDIHEFFRAWKLL